VVYDRTAHAEVERVTVSPASVDSVDVQADGTSLVVLRDDGGAVHAAWTSPSSPTLHELGLTGEEVRAGISGSSVGFLRFRSRTPTVADAGVMDLDGHVTASVARPGALDGFDYDGTRLVFKSQPCATATIEAWDLSGPPPVEPAPGAHCPLPEVSTRAARLGHDGRVAVALSCARDPALGCSGTLRLYAFATSGRGRRRHTSEYAFRPAHYRIDPGTRATARVELSRGARTFVRRFHRVRVAAIAVTDRRRGDQTERPLATKRGAFTLSG
jgi:hypothetical protein